MSESSLGKWPKKDARRVSCPCPFCVGHLVSPYVRRQHCGRFHMDQGGRGHRKPAAEDGVTSTDEPHSDVELTRAGPTLMTKLTRANSDEELTRANSDDELTRANSDDELTRANSDDELTRANSDDELTRANSDDEITRANSDDSDARSNSDDEELRTECETGTRHTFDGGLYESGVSKLPLYEGSTSTVLEVLAELFEWFTSHPGTSKESLSGILYMQHHTLLPAGNELPDNYRAALKIVKPFLIDTIIYDACPNDCILFRGHNSNLDICPVCGMERFKNGNIPVRSFTYMPLGPRLERLFGTSNLAQIVQSHHCSSEQQIMYDIHDSKVWRNAYKKTGILGGDSRGINLSLCTDGVNPFSHHRVSYSMWPIMLTLLNLPRNIRTEFSNIFLVGIIPGNGKGEAKSISPYLEVLADEILQMSCSTLYDAYQKANFELKVDLLLYILDYPGINKVFGVSGSGAYQGCVWCEVQGDYNHDLCKMVYLQNRRYLTSDSPLRKQSEVFPGKCSEERKPPKLRCWRESVQVHAAFDNASKSASRIIAKATGHKSSYSLMKLPNHNPLEQSVPDAMHTIKDVIENLFKLITGKKDKRKIDLSEETLGRSISDFSLTKVQLRVADERMSAICTPIHIDFRIRSLFIKFSYMKSHDWKQFASQGIMKFCLRGFFGERQRNTLFYFLNVVRDLLEEFQSASQLEELSEQVNTALALLEQDFPITIQVITLHLMHHIVDGMKKYGPVYTTWMYPFERFNSWMCQRVKNRAHPEATIMETYRIYEWCNYMRSSGRLTSQSFRTKPDKECIELIKEKELLPTQVQELDDFYRSNNTQYSKLIKEYDGDRKRRKKDSGFPSMEHWIPPAKELTLVERSFLCGPSKNIKMLRRLSVRDTRTNRLITYTCTPHDSSNAQKVSSSYIAIRGENASICESFGCIESLLQHSFGGETYKFAIVNIYGKAVKDKDSGIWNVSDKSVKSALIPLSGLLSPLTVAFESNRVWFLSF